MGAGATKRLSAVRWGVAGNIVFAWILTIPASAAVAALVWWPDQADLRRMKLGLGAGSGLIYVLLAQAGEAALEVVQAVERRIVEWPSGPTQDEVKALEHVADSVVSELLRQTNALFVTPVRPRGRRHARLRGGRGRRRSRERRRAASASTASSRRRSRRSSSAGCSSGQRSSSRRCSPSLKGMHGSSDEIRRDQGDRGRGRRRRARRAREPLQGRPHRPGRS